MTGKKTGNHIIKTAFAAALAVTITAASVPSILHAQQAGIYENSRNMEDETAGCADSEPVRVSDSCITRNTDVLLTDEPYEPGQVLILYDRFAGISDEELVGSFGAGDETPIFSGNTSIVDTVSGESYQAATGETLPAIDPEQVVGSSGQDEPGTAADKDRLSILLVEDAGKSTEELLEEVLQDPTVLYAQPNYVHWEEDAVEKEIPDSSSDRTTERQGEEVVAALESPETAVGEIDDTAVSENPETAVGGTDDTAALENPETAVGGTDDTAALESPEATVGEIDEPDLTGLQWEHVAPVWIPATDSDRSSIYNIHVPGWNEPGETNAEGVVAVLDGGVDYTHPDLRNVMYKFSPELQEKLNCGPYGVNLTGQGDPRDPMDIKGHGTHCAGVVAASWNGLGVGGMTSGCRVMAVKISTGEGLITDLGILKGMAFTADAADQGVDVRVTSNSYGGVISCPLFSVEMEELEKRGIVCVYSSGNDGIHNDISDVTPNQFTRASNTVIVNAATEAGTKAYFTNYGECTTDVYAPGTGILSTVTTQNGLTANRNKTYFGVFDPSAVYYNTSFDILPILHSETADGVKISGRQITDSYSYDADGKAFLLTIDEMEYETSVVSFVMDIPVGDRENVSYISMAACVPDGQNGVGIQMEGSRPDGQYTAESSHTINSEGGWIFVSLSGVPDRIAQGDRFSTVRSEDGSQNCVRITVNINKHNGDFAVGDTVYIDQIGVGTDNKALLPYGFMDGTSMACPHVAAEAAILYCGKTRSQTNAAEVVREIKSRVISGVTLDQCRSHGAIDLSVAPDSYAPVVENAQVDGKTGTITLTGCNFRSSGRVYLDGNPVKTTSWNESEIVFICPDSMRSGVLRVRVETDTGSGSFGFSADVPGGIRDSASPLYEHDIPEIPEKLFPDGSTVCGAVGLNDYLYLILQDELDYENKYAKKMIRYSIREKTWEGAPDLPESLCDLSAAGYRGKILVSGTYQENGEDHTTVFSYSPGSMEWKDLRLDVTRASMLVNFKGTLYTMGGVICDEDGQEECGTDVMILNPEDGSQKSAGTLDIGIMNGYTATDENAIYLAGGFKIDNGNKRENRQNLQKLTVSADGTLSSEWLMPVLRTASGSYPRYDVIAGYQGVYMIGHVGTSAKGMSLSEYTCEKDVTLSEIYDGFETVVGEGAGSYVDAEGSEVLDADTFILKGEDYSAYDRRFSHDLVSLVRPVEYKGELYAFGWSVYDGDSCLNFISRSTSVMEANAPAWDTVTVKLPAAAEGLVCNGAEQTGVPESPEGYYSVTGNKAAPAGTYTATLKLSDPDWYVWEDGTTEDKNITWTIAEEASPTVTEEPSVTAPSTVTGAPTVTSTVTAVPAITSGPTERKMTVMPGPTGKSSATAATGSTGKASATAAPEAAGKKFSTAARTGDTSRPFVWAVLAIGAMTLLNGLLRKR